MIFLNYILILLLLVAVALAVYFYYKKLTHFSDMEFESPQDMDLHGLVIQVSDAFANIQKKNLREMNLSRHDYERRLKSKARLRDDLRESAFGNLEAKRRIKGYIRDMIQEPQFGVNEGNINNLIHFDQEKYLTGQDKFEILMYLYGKVYGDENLEHLLIDNGLDLPLRDEDNNEIYDVTASRLNAVYASYIVQHPLSYSDKLEILSQRIFQNFKGFGAADLLFEAKVDEIDGGVSGIPESGYDIKTKLKGITYSYDAIWVLFHGINIHLSCIGFGSQNELVRVCNNVYKYHPSHMLSIKDPAVVTTMKDGSRVVVVRPPLADSYMFYVRKFDTVESIAPEQLITDDNSVIPLTLLKWMIRGERNIAITGSQGVGKTTLLKSLFTFIPPKYTLRIQELAFELSARYAYPDRNISSLQETSYFTAQEGLNLQKKMNGNVNIIGEVAEAQQASYIIQTALVASLFAMFSHHAKTARALIEAIGNNLLELGLFSNRDDAYSMAAKVINIDCHMEKQGNRRYIERITEIIPVASMPYPSEMLHEEGVDLLAEDTKEYYRRSTDRQLFKTVDLMRWEDGKFYFLNMPSNTMLSGIRSKLSPEDAIQFDNELAMISSMTKEREGAS